MPAPGSRKRSAVSSSYAARLAKMRQRAGQARFSMRRADVLRNLQRQVRVINSHVEVKEAARRITNVQMGHNALTVFNNSAGGIFNPFEITNGGGQDPMGIGGQRIGDKITVKTMLFKFMVEGSLNRSKVHFRFMLVKLAKGDTLTTATFFKGVSGNKMIDQINTERYTIIAQKSFNVYPPNAPPATIVSITGIPATAAVSGITGNKVFSMSVPGKKFGKNGNVTYENESNTQVKFYDYRLVCVAYDWYGTPETNNVGFVNDGYVKIYFKDA